jgi:hypothetical protein
MHRHILPEILASDSPISTARCRSEYKVLTSRGSGSLVNFGDTIFRSPSVYYQLVESSDEPYHRSLKSLLSQCGNNDRDYTMTIISALCFSLHGSILTEGFIELSSCWTVSDGYTVPKI